MAIKTYQQRLALAEHLSRSRKALRVLMDLRGYEHLVPVLVARLRSRECSAKRLEALLQPFGTRSTAEEEVLHELLTVAWCTLPANLA